MSPSILIVAAAPPWPNVIVLGPQFTNVRPNSVILSVGPVLPPTLATIISLRSSKPDVLNPVPLSGPVNL